MKAFRWVCEFCFRTNNREVLPQGWDWVWQSAVCPKCKRKVARITNMVRAQTERAAL
jgi:hypothetical protein